MQLINTIRSFEINSVIVEWDIRSAGINIIQEYKLLPEDKIKALLKLPKKKMNIAVGEIGRKDKDFAKELENKFNEVTHLFINENSLDIDYDIVSVKRDAIFVINKEIVNSRFGEYIEFIPKNRYSRYLYLKPYEFYVTPEGTIDIKGISSDKELRENFINKHKDGILNLILELIYVAEGSNLDREKINDFLASFVSMYKNKELDYAYYREFTLDSKFRCNMFGNTVLMDEVNDYYLAKTDISYNYINIILPLIRLTCLR